MKHDFKLTFTMLNRNFEKYSKNILKTNKIITNIYKRNKTEINYQLNLYS